MWMLLESRPTVVVHLVKLPLVTKASHSQVPVPVSAILFLIQLQADASGKAVKDGPGVRHPTTYLRDQGGVPCSWLQPSL